MAGIAPCNPLYSPRPCGLDAGGTSPWMGEGRIKQEQLSRATQDAKSERASRSRTSCSSRHSHGHVLRTGL